MPLDHHPHLLIVEVGTPGLHRRVKKEVGGSVFEIVWDGWQAVEEYADGQLTQRRTYGRGLDEIVLLESDLDGDGMLEQS